MAADTKTGNWFCLRVVKTITLDSISAEHEAMLDKILALRHEHINRVVEIFTENDEPNGAICYTVEAAFFGTLAEKNLANEMLGQSMTTHEVQTIFK